MVSIFNSLNSNFVNRKMKLLRKGKAKSLRNRVSSMQQQAMMELVRKKKAGVANETKKYKTNPSNVVHINFLKHD